ncbi:hypothetical protein JOF56_007933 [Kibdelosporangium banguiense]|uniref:Uncharacterized protein n=1 Tax=Kibdelosporangium banguiense TaxID=1365924 RepID=A0ABS4TUA5_9PSEU|nr:hypothetical protein [Kibdelosporangium banguiense]MBP2327548.1 hypothetical protein [Kibdelosporangium banguiense]
MFGPGQTLTTEFEAGDQRQKAVFQVLAGGRAISGERRPDTWYIDVQFLLWLLHRIQAGDTTAEQACANLAETTRTELVWRW